MSIDWTIGSGGTDPELGASITRLAAVGGLSDDYNLTNISSYTITTQETATIGPLNNHTVRITSNNPPNGSPVGGWITTISTIINWIQIDPTSGGTVIFENQNIVNIRESGSVWALFNILVLGATSANINIIYNNIIFNNQEAPSYRAAGIYIHPSDSSVSYRILNSKFYSLYEAFLRFNTTLNCGVFIENVVSDLCVRGIEFLPASPATFNNVFLRNVVSMRTVFLPDWDFNSDASGYTIENCADGDNTLTEGSNNQHNISVNNEFQSVNITQSNYLKLTPGTVQNNNYTPGAKQLGQTGIRPEYAGDTDIEGNSRPDANGWYSIGPGSQSYIEITEPEIFTNDHFSDIYRKRIEIIKTKEIEPGKIIITDRNNVIASDENPVISYEFDSEYGTVASAFSCVLVDNGADIKKGYGIQLLVKNKVIFRGTIERRNHVISKDTNQVILSGRDRAAILVVGHCKNFKDYNNQSPVSIIDDLVSQTNFYVQKKGSITDMADFSGFNHDDDMEKRNSVILADLNNSDTINERNDITTYDSDFNNLSVISHYKISIGDLVFEKINQLVKSQGFEILYQPNGTLYIGNLEKKRRYDNIIYEINNNKTGPYNNVLSSSFIEDISGRYSTVSISSQAEGYRYSSNFPSVNEEKIAIDSTLEDKKYYAELINDTVGSAEKYAIQKREDQRIEGYQVIYKVPGHVADNGNIWDINRFVNVFDDMHNINTGLVLYGRTFSFDKDSGTRTILRVSLERINQLEI